MPLSDVVQVTITTATKGIAQAGFGTPLIVGYHTNYLDRVREYTDLASLVTDGFTVYDPIYRAAAAAWAQTPHPTSFKVGRRALPFTETIDLTPTDTTEDLVYTLKVLSPDGTETTCTYTVLSGDAVADIVAGLQTPLNAIADLTATDNTTKVTCAADNAGEYFYFEELNAELELTDVTADPGIATDLAAIHLADPDWYGLAIDSNSVAEILAAAAWVETLDRIAAFYTKDAGVKDSGVSDDVASDLQTSAYARCVIKYSADHSGYGGAAWLGRMLPTNPGSASWVYKTLTGVAADVLTTTEQSTVEGKNCNHYQSLASVNITRWGISPAGEFIDITRGRDWLKARIQEEVYNVLVNNPKVPYTDAGADLIRGAILSVLDQGVKRGFLAADPAYTITVPLVSAQTTTNKANRIFSDIHFEATVAGAIHTVVITGTISV